MSMASRLAAAQCAPAVGTGRAARPPSGRESSRAKLDCIVSLTGAAVQVTTNTLQERPRPVAVTVLSAAMITLYISILLVLALRRAPPGKRRGFRVPRQLAHSCSGHLTPWILLSI